MSYIYKNRGIYLSYNVSGEPKESDYHMHIHDRYEILCFVSGNVRYLVEGREYPMYPGCLMIVRPAEIHKLIVVGAEEYERYVLSFRGDVLRDCGLSEDLLRPFNDRELGEKNQYNRSELYGIDTINLFKKMYAECKVMDSNSVMLANFLPLLTALNFSFLKKENLEVQRDGSEVGRKMIAYINENLAEHISLKSVSEHVHMSPSQVNKIFRKMTGTSVYDYIISKRIVMVQNLMAAGEGAVVASQKCGFGDYSSFYRAYKKRMGNAPNSRK